MVLYFSIKLLTTYAHLRKKVLDPRSWIVFSAPPPNKYKFTHIIEMLLSARALKRDYINRYHKTIEYCVLYLGLDCERVSYLDQH